MSNIINITTERKNKLNTLVEYAKLLGAFVNDPLATSKSLSVKEDDKGLSEEFKTVALDIEGKYTNEYGIEKGKNILISKVKDLAAALKAQETEIQATYKTLAENVANSFNVALRNFNPDKAETMLKGVAENKIFREYYETKLKESIRSVLFSKINCNDQPAILLSKLGKVMATATEDFKKRLEADISEFKTNSDKIKACHANKGTLLAGDIKPSDLNKVPSSPEGIINKYIKNIPGAEQEPSMIDSTMTFITDIKTGLPLLRECVEKYINCLNNLAESELAVFGGILDNFLNEILLPYEKLGITAEDFNSGLTMYESLLQGITTVDTTYLNSLNDREIDIKDMVNLYVQLNINVNDCLAVAD